MGHLANYALVDFLWHVLTTYKHYYVVINSQNLTGVHIRWRGLKKCIPFPPGWISSGTVSDKLDVEISSRFLPTCTYIPRLKTEEKFTYQLVFNRGEFETGKHVMLSTRV